MIRNVLLAATAVLTLAACETSNTYLVQGAADQAQAGRAATARTVPHIATAAVNVRAEPSANAKIVGHLNDGDRVHSFGASSDGKWLAIGDPVTGSITGYVSSTLVRQEGQAQTPRAVQKAQSASKSQSSAPSRSSGKSSTSKPDVVRGGEGKGFDAGSVVRETTGAPKDFDETSVVRDSSKQQGFDASRIVRDSTSSAPASRDPGSFDRSASGAGEVMIRQ
ncbi:SH3 domain-containing protein [Roseomonas genomospecies 6]|nr:SH3 domain-containing protein [Roseomonas genomospecies 6]